jgi:hypothetical protein
MMDDIATTLRTAMNRVVENSVDIIAKEGLIVLKQTLDTAGFLDSEFLKNYKIYAHAYGGTVEFEIVLDEEAIIPADQVSEKDIAKERAAEKAAKRKLEERARTYGWGSHGPRRLISKNKPAKDARKPARDARRSRSDFASQVIYKKDEDMRTLEHEIALTMPRSARITNEGKLSVSTRRVVQKTKTGVQLPQGDNQGIIAKFMDQLDKVIANTFVPKLGDIIAKYAGE